MITPKIIPFRKNDAILKEDITPTKDMLAESLVDAMLRLCLCGICENSWNGDGEVYYFGGSCEGELGCCLGGHRIRSAA